MSCVSRKDSTGKSTEVVNGVTSAMAAAEQEDTNKGIALNYIRKIVLLSMVTGAVITYIRTRNAQTKVFNEKSLA
jgi:hypothetical protein